MTNNYNYLFQYLEKEGITFDKSKFLYQIQSHPDYPTLIALTDTLNFFKISNGVIKVGQSDIDLLPERFISFQNDQKRETLPFFIEKNNDFYTLTHDQQTLKISKSELYSGWTGTVLLVEKNDMPESIALSKRKFPLLLSITLLLFFINFYFISASSIAAFLVFFPLAGVLLSIASLKDVLGIKNTIIDGLCSGSDATSCNQIQQSVKWKLFKYIELSDLSLTFFLSQSLGFFVFTSNWNLGQYLIFQKTLLFMSLPFLLSSLYFQKYVEKKWCQICLLIITTILLEFSALLYLTSWEFSFSIRLAVLFALLFFATALVWQKLKKILNENKKLRDLEIRANRFIRNYETFKRFLLLSKKTDFIDLGHESIWIGNPRSKVRLVLVFSPFCKHCEATFRIVTKILQEYDGKIGFDIRFDVSTNDDVESQEIHQKFLQIYLQGGEIPFMEALAHWFRNLDKNSLEEFVTGDFDDQKVTCILEKQFQMNQENEIRYTPTIIINQYVFPKEYQKEELIYFIEDLLEDENF